MRVLLPLCFLLASLQQPDPALERQVRWPIVPAGEANPTFSRVLATKSGVFALGGPGIVRLTELELTSATVQLPAQTGRTILDVAAWKSGFVVLLEDEQGQFALEARWQDGESKLPTPPIRHRRGRDQRPIDIGGSPCIATSGETLILCVGCTIARFEHEAWTKTQLDLGDRTLLCPPERALFDGSRLFLAVDKGEWGGQLVAVDPQSGKASIESDGWSRLSNNVRHMDLAPDGRLFVTCGVAHLGLKWSALYRHDGTVWTRLVGDDGEQEVGSLEAVERPDGTAELGEVPVEVRNAKIRSRTRATQDGWQVPSCTFVALAFDSRQRPVVLCDAYGLFRQASDGAWSWITPGWTAASSGVVDMTLLGERALFATEHAGLVVLDLETLEAKRVSLP